MKLRKTLYEQKYNVLFHNGPNTDGQYRTIIDAESTDDAMNKAYSLPQAKQYDNVTVSQRFSDTEKSRYMVNFKILSYINGERQPRYDSSDYMGVNARSENEAKYYYMKYFFQQNK